MSYFNKNLKKFIGQMTIVGHNEKIKVKTTVLSTIIKKNKNKNHKAIEP